MTLQREIHKKKPFDSPHQEAFLNLVRTASMLQGAFDRLFKANGLSAASYNVLRILRASGSDGRMCHEIGEHMITEVPDITRLVDRLERDGLATRRRCNEDRRVVWVKITPAGLKLIAKLDEPVMAMHAAQLQHMPKPKLAQLSELLVEARSAALKSEGASATANSVAFESTAARSRSASRQSAVYGEVSKPARASGRGGPAADPEGE